MTAMCPQMLLSLVVVLDGDPVDHCFPSRIRDAGSGKRQDEYNRE